MTNGLILEVALVFEDQGAGLVWAVRRGTGVLGGTLLLVHHIADVVLEGVSADSLLHINTHVRVLLSTFFFVAGNTRHLLQKSKFFQIEYLRDLLTWWLVHSWWYEVVHTSSYLVVQ